ncbi:MAG: glycine betaine/L-proline ABC transporter substrate-binding protein ProX [Chloroflexota bacterium]
MQRKQIILWILLSVLVALPLAIALKPASAQTQPPQIGQGRTIRMARATWDTGWFQAEIFKQLFEGLGYQVEGPRTYDNDTFYQAVAQGDVDLWVNGWFPQHDIYLTDETIATAIDIVGVEVQGGALQGYMVDKASAEALSINSLADFKRPEVIAAFDPDGDGRANLIGCNTGWGCATVIDHHLVAYELTETVEHIQGDYGPLMLNTLSQFQRGAPIFYFNWTPNWTNGALVPGQDVVWIEVPFASLPPEQRTFEDNITVSGLDGCVKEPCALGFPPNDIRTVASKAFLNTHPDIQTLLEQVAIPLNDISDQNALLLAGEDDQSDIIRHAQEWIKTHQDEVDEWLANAVDAYTEAGGTIIDLSTASETEQAATASQPVLRVATKPFEPFVIYDIQTRQYTGFSIELWEAIANELNIEYELYGVNSLAKLLDDVERGMADVGTAGIGITSTREQHLDFSHAFFEAGLQVMIADDSGGIIDGTLLRVLSVLFTVDLLYILGFLVFMLLVSAHIMWLLERHYNPEFPRGYVEGVWEAFWWAAVTATTVGYGDKTPKGTLGRIFGLFWMFAGLFILAYFTAGVTSTVTLQQLQGVINGPEDLVNKSVGTVDKSAAAEYLIRQGIQPIEFANQAATYQALENGDIQAVVYDAPVLQHYASHDGQGRVKMVGLTFEALSYGIAFQHDSPHRETVNQALLKLVEDGTYQEIHDKWFGAEEGQ